MFPLPNYSENDFNPTFFMRQTNFKETVALLKILNATAGGSTRLKFFLTTHYYIE